MVNSNFSRYGLIDYVILIYMFSMGLLIVTPSYYLLNYFSIALCIISIPFLIKLSSIFYSKLLWFYTLQLCWLFFCLFFIEHQDNGFNGLISLGKNVITAIIPALFINTTIKFRNALCALLVGGMINIIGNVNNGISSLSSGIRYISEDDMLSLNSFAHFTLIILFTIAILLFHFKSKLIKVFLLLFFLISIVSLVITGSRQSFISLFCAVLFFFGYNLKNVSPKKVFLGLGVAVIFIVIGYFIFIYFPESPLVRRFMTGPEDDDQSRVDMYKKVLYLFESSPISGYGVSNFKFYSPYVYAHSTPAELLFNGGLPLIILFFTFYFLFFRKIRMLQYNKFVNISFFEINLLRSIILAILINGLFYLIHASRISLTFQFCIINYLLCMTVNKRHSSIKKQIQK